MGKLITTTETRKHGDPAIEVDNVLHHHAANDNTAIITGEWLDPKV
jgi:hypothetical protein